MISVLNARWLSKGWRAMDKDDVELMALAFIEDLDRFQIPHHFYRELYHRAVELRSQRLAMGLQCDDFSAEMMMACWASLQAEVRQREIDAGRTLPSTAQSQCERCLGNEAGLERVFDAQGNAAGLRKNCDHRPIVEGEGIWLHLQRLKENAKPRAVERP